MTFVGTSTFEHLTFFHPLDASITTFSQSEIPIYILMGLGIGFCGALWNYVQIYINAYRRKYVLTIKVINYRFYLSLLT